MFLPLGGVGEIGMNLYLYGYGRDGAREWLIVDMGVTFGSEYEPGIDVILPDIRFLEEERHNIVGLLLTHAHEDHFGAVIDLWPFLSGVTVYATPFTAEMLKSKLAEIGLVNGFPLEVLPMGARCTIGPFDVELISHVAFDPRAVRRGDPDAAWRRAAYRRLEARREPADQRADRYRAPQGARRGWARGADLRFDQCRARRRLGVGGRCRARARTAHPRGVAPRGGHHLRLERRAPRARSPRLRVPRAASLSWSAAPCIASSRQRRRPAISIQTLPFTEETAFESLPPRKVVALCTGSQGEARAAMARIALDEHPNVSLDPGDRVIFSSRTIPGNEKAVARVQNGLADRGVEVITDQDAPVHVSGHPRRGELEQLYGWLRPKIAIPDARRRAAPRSACAACRAARRAARWCVRGTAPWCASLPGPAAIIDDVPTGRLYRDGLILDPRR